MTVGGQSAAEDVSPNQVSNRLKSVSASHFRRASLIVVLMVAIAALVGIPGQQSGKSGDVAPSLRITSPLGRTGLVTTVHIVAQITVPPGFVLSPVQFYVEGKLVGTVDDGPPYAVDVDRRQSVRETRNSGSGDRRQTAQSSPIRSSFRRLRSLNALR